MVRLVAFFLVAMVLYGLLGQLPFLGPFFQRLGCFGVWITAILLSWAVTRFGDHAIRRGRDRAAIRKLEAVGSPHNHGKIGTLFLKQGRVRRSLEHLRLAAEGDPEVAEWHYRHGCALSILKRHEEALEALGRAVAIDEEHAYGGAQMRLAEALSAVGHDQEALAALQVFERNHGPMPESAYRRGRALERLGDPAAAREAFDEVGRLAKQVASYQKREAALWSLRAKLAAWF